MLSVAHGPRHQRFHNREAFTTRTSKGILGSARSLGDATSCRLRLLAAAGAPPAQRSWERSVLPTQPTCSEPPAGPRSSCAAERSNGQTHQTLAVHNKTLFTQQAVSNTKSFTAAPKTRLSKQRQISPAIPVFG